MPLDSLTVTEVDVEFEPVVLILDRARALIERGWSRREMARTWWGWPVSVTHPSASRFCALGAIHRAALDLGLHPMYGGNGGNVVKAVASVYVRSTHDCRSIGTWNDDRKRSQREVLYTFDRAIRAKIGEFVHAA